jgi:hypothetical protein
MQNLRTYTKTISFLLLWVVVAASMGFVLVEHWCMMRGKSLQAFQKPAFCCLDGEENSSQNNKVPQQESRWEQSPCCKVTSSLLKSDLELKDLSTQAFSLVALRQLLYSYDFANITSVALRVATFPFDSSPAPPKPFGRQALVAYSIFLI